MGVDRMKYWYFTAYSGSARVGVGPVPIVAGRGSDVGPSGSVVTAYRH